MDFSVVVIGRNQANLLNECLTSVKTSTIQPSAIFYIDTASEDDSLEIASHHGATALSINPSHPNAATSRNAGWKMVKSPLVLFLDGDTLLDSHFAEHALPLFSNPEVAVVCGQRRERTPSASIYQYVLDIDWIYPTGDVDFCGGDAFIRKATLEETNGYNESLIAGEEPDLCARIREKGYRVVREDIPMTLHDLKMYTFSQYWKRCFRTGYGYANVSDLQNNLWKQEAKHNLWKGSLFMALFTAGIALLPWSYWPLLLIGVFMTLLIFRTAIKVHERTNSWVGCFWYGLHAHFQHIPMFFGQISYRRKKTRLHK